MHLEPREGKLVTGEDAGYAAGFGSAGYVSGFDTFALVSAPVGSDPDGFGTVGYDGSVGYGLVEPGHIGSGSRVSGSRSMDDETGIIGCSGSRSLTEPGSQTDYVSPINSEVQ